MSAVGFSGISYAGSKAAIGHQTFAPELQGLRAIAVLMVLIFHLNPYLLSGGYVGVDAFFVLSGYLITGSLVREIEKTGIIDFPKFYERRFRRLLPAATLVLAAMIVFIGVFPRDQWPYIVREVAASSIYLQNIYLAHHSVDYLAFDRVASPVQHFWSLSVEEQFYFVWPLILVCSVAFRSMIDWSVRRACMVAIVSVLVLSLAASVVSLHAPKPSDYFYTHLRMWELALGGLIAVATPKLQRFASGSVGSLIQWVGLGMLVASSVVFTAQTVFPGYAALVPTVGAGLVILVAGRATPTSHNVILSNRIMRWIGDISYSVYLWHWPIIVCYRDHVARPIDFVASVPIVLLVFGLSHLTKVYVEDRFRAGNGPGKRIAPISRKRTFTVVAAMIAVPLLLSVVMLGYVTYDKRRFDAAILDPHDYPGAEALLAPPGTTVPVRPFFPPAHFVSLDLPKIYAENCSLPHGFSQIQSCPAGASDSSRTIALVGDSHAAQWVPAFDIGGKAFGWKVIPLTKSSCPLVSIRLKHADAPFCEEWTRNVMAYLDANPPDVIVYSLYLDGEISDVVPDEARLATVRSTLTRLARSGATVIVLRDTPRLNVDPIPSVESTTVQPVVLTIRSRRDVQDVTEQAAMGWPAIKQLNMNDLICPKNLCFNIIGNVVVWRDQHHLAAHYAQTLAVPLMDRVGRLIGDGPAAK